MENSNQNQTRIRYCPKASKGERNMGLGGFEEKKPPCITDFRPTADSHPENWKHLDKYPQMRTTKLQNNHPTVKPLALMEYLCILTKTPTGGIVLDPFGGSGTTGMACKKTGRDYILIEKEKEYCKIAEARIKAVQAPLI